MAKTRLEKISENIVAFGKQQQAIQEERKAKMLEYLKSRPEFAHLYKENK